MGSNEAWKSDANPVHRVTVDSFYIAKYEVTFEEYDKFCEEMKKDKPPDQGMGRGRRPVIEVNWYDAVEYCNWLSSQEGFVPCYTIKDKTVVCDFTANGYRLPTEAEWEYAARGGHKSKGYIYCGGNLADEVGWYFENAEVKTHPVGEKKPNELGLYDMGGNVWEWCWDRYDENYYQKSPRNNPQGPSAGSLRVVRGGSYRYPSYCLVPDYRFYSHPLYGSDHLGFRLVRKAEK